jgi:hypothetical protein
MNGLFPLFLGVLAIALLVALILFAKSTGSTAPQLWAIGTTNGPGDGTSIAMLCLSNSTGRRITLSGSQMGAPDYVRELRGSAGWEPADAPLRPVALYAWGLDPAATCVFGVPVATNQAGPWRVTVRYLDGGRIVQVPSLPAIRA